MHGRPEGPVPSRRGTSGSNHLSSSSESDELSPPSPTENGKDAGGDRTETVTPLGAAL